MKIRPVGVELLHAVGQNVYIMGLISGNERGNMRGAETRTVHRNRAAITWCQKVMISK